MILPGLERAGSVSVDSGDPDSGMSNMDGAGRGKDDGFGGNKGSKSGANKAQNNKTKTHTGGSSDTGARDGIDSDPHVHVPKTCVLFCGPNAGSYEQLAMSSENASWLGYVNGVYVYIF